ncbi:MAG TPA: flagellar hook-associated protein FlgK [Mobilitalea sp.]|nr:flagellar hook-associated protein FlgK [Mobilitalea sp.]
MASTFFGLNIGQSGLYTYQAALDTTSHNISNAETDGYSKQVISQKAGKPLPMNSTYGMAGTGVTVNGVTQLRDEYYDIKYWNNNTLYGEYSSKSHYMAEIENYFNEVNDDGFTTAYNSMNDSLQELQKNPSSLTVRTQLVNYAESLTEYFNSTATNLKGVQQECNFEIKNQVDQINSISQQISALTKQINTLEVNGGKANDLRDQRALLVDNLSQIANISVTEKTVGTGVGVTSYVVKIDGVVLVDGGNTNQLKVVPRDLKCNQNDIDGLYDIVWDNGQKFNERSETLGGTLQALLEVRDGNNQYNLQGTVNAQAGDNYVTMTDTNINSEEKLNIPETGVITVGNRNYNYTGFQVTKDTLSGAFTYTFELQDSVTVDAIEEKSSVGESIDYKGIPYYMSQLNEFTRTFAKAFNDIHRTGVDLNGDSGMDFFNAKSKISGRNYTFGPLKGSDDSDYYDYNTFNSQTGGYYDEVTDNQPLYGSYYLMTAENFCVTDDLIKDPNKLVTATDVVDGVENNDVIDKLLAMKDDKMLFQQGAPDGFFQTLIAEVGIDADKANSFSDGQQNILDTIKNQRLSVSGVDTDEEAMNLVRYQNAYNLSAKVISVMNEIYDKLINYMGV